jgi:MFS family permease
MLEKQPRQIFGIRMKTAFASVVIVANPFVWYYAVVLALQGTLAKMSADTSTAFLIWAIHFSGLIIAALIGAALASKIEKKRFLAAWMLLGIIASLTLALVNTTDVLILTIQAGFLGATLGVGMPTCMRYFTNNITVEKRGRISGIVMITFVLGLVLFSVVGVGNMLIFGLALAVWRLASLVIYLSTGAADKTKAKVEASSYKQILGQRAFYLYFIPWVMFSLVNYLPISLQLKIVGPELNSSITLIQNLVLGIFAFVGGFLIDIIGRKRTAIAAFVMIGISTSVLGAYYSDIYAWLFFAVVSGIAWGFLFVLFILTIWGDLSYSLPSDKFYALGVMPFFVSQLLGFTLGPNIADIVPEYALFSFVAFFLFLAVLPMVYAPETLPEKLMKDRDLKSYAEKALKQAQKDAGKGKKKSDKAGEEKKEPKESPEDEEARKLAEKYY